MKKLLLSIVLLSALVHFETQTNVSVYAGTQPKGFYEQELDRQLATTSMGISQQGLAQARQRARAQDALMGGQQQVSSPAQFPKTNQ